MNHRKEFPRVVFTGMGLITPLGLGIEENWTALIAGQSGIAPITRFNASPFPSQIAGEVKGFHPADFMRKRDLPRTDLFTQYALAASRMALEDAGLEGKTEGAENAAVVIGVSMGGIPALEEQHHIYLEHGFARVSPFTVPRTIPNLAPGFVALEMGIRGTAFSVGTACASSGNAIEIAARMIKLGEIDWALVGGTEAILSPIGFGSFCAMRALSTRNETPHSASRPFDQDRDGFVMSEGATMLVMESLEHAQNRGARIYAELAGHASNNDAHHFTSPHPKGTGAAQCMARALRSAGMEPNDVDYINAHGTSTRDNDRSETLAIKTALGDHAAEIPVSSTKSMTGHLLGAASSTEAAISMLAMSRGVIPPTINLDTADPDCNLDYVPNRARRAEIQVALTNSFAFGGTNVTLVLKRWPHN